MKKLIVVLVLFCVGHVFAAEDTPQSRLKEADRYLAATPPKDLIANVAEQMARTVPPEQRQTFKDALTKNLDMEVLAEAMKDAMVKNFTTEELKALADFYGSPIGKAAMKKIGPYMADVMPIVQAEVMKAMAKTNLELPGASPN